MAPSRNEELEDRTRRNGPRREVGRRERRHSPRKEVCIGKRRRPKSSRKEVVCRREERRPESRSVVVEDDCGEGGKKKKKKKIIIREGEGGSKEGKKMIMIRREVEGSEDGKMICGTGGGIYIIGAEASGDEEGSEPDCNDENEEEEDEDEEESIQIKDETETNLVNLRRTIYLTIMSSVDFEEAGHKLSKIKLEPGQEMELCYMLLECCSQERTYLRLYGLLGQRFCNINKVYQENFEKCFVQQYSMVHRLETNKLRNVARFFAHLLGTGALPWQVLAYIRLTEEDTTSSSRIFIKVLFQELSQHLSIRQLNERLNDPAMQDSFEAFLPKDNTKNTRFSINFFTSIGLGGITESLREYLKSIPRLIMQQQERILPADERGGSSSGSSSSELESESESSSGKSRRSERHQKRQRRS